MRSLATDKPVPDAFERRRRVDDCSTNNNYFGFLLCGFESGVAT